MPLKPGKSRATVSQNIREMRTAGHAQDQSVAAALRMARETKADGGRTGKFARSDLTRRGGYSADDRESDNVEDRRASASSEPITTDVSKSRYLYRPGSRPQIPQDILPTPRARGGIIARALQLARGRGGYAGYPTTGDVPPWLRQHFDAGGGEGGGDSGGDGGDGSGDGGGGDASSGEGASSGADASSGEGADSGVGEGPGADAASGEGPGVDSGVGMGMGESDAMGVGSDDAAAADDAAVDVAMASPAPTEEGPAPNVAPNNPQSLAPTQAPNPNDPMSDAPADPDPAPTTDPDPAIDIAETEEAPAPTSLAALMALGLNPNDPDVQAAAANNTSVSTSDVSTADPATASLASLASQVGLDVATADPAPAPATDDVGPAIAQADDAAAAVAAAMAQSQANPDMAPAPDVVSTNMDAPAPAPDPDPAPAPNVVAMGPALQALQNAPQTEEETVSLPTMTVDPQDLEENPALEVGPPAPAPAPAPMSLSDIQANPEQSLQGPAPAPSVDQETAALQSLENAQADPEAVTATVSSPDDVAAPAPDPAPAPAPQTEEGPPAPAPTVAPAPAPSVADPAPAPAVDPGPAPSPSVGPSVGPSMGPSTGPGPGPSPGGPNGVPTSLAELVAAIEQAAATDAGQNTSMGRSQQLGYSPLAQGGAVRRKGYADGGPPSSLADFFQSLNPTSAGYSPTYWGDTAQHLAQQQFADHQPMNLNIAQIAGQMPGYLANGPLPPLPDPGTGGGGGGGGTGGGGIGGGGSGSGITSNQASGSGLTGGGGGDSSGGGSGLSSITDPFSGGGVPAGLIFHRGGAVHNALRLARAMGGYAEGGSPVPDYLLEQQREGIPTGGDTNQPPGLRALKGAGEIVGNIGRAGKAIGEAAWNSLPEGLPEHYHNFIEHARNPNFSPPTLAEFGRDTALPTMATALIPAIPRKIGAPIAAGLVASMLGHDKSEAAEPAKSPAQQQLDAVLEQQRMLAEARKDAAANRDLQMKGDPARGIKPGSGPKYQQSVDELGRIDAQLNALTAEGGPLAKAQARVEAENRGRLRAESDTKLTKAEEDMPAWQKGLRDYAPSAGYPLGMLAGYYGGKGIGKLFGLGESRAVARANALIEPLPKSVTAKNVNQTVGPVNAFWSEGQRNPRLAEIPFPTAAGQKPPFRSNPNAPQSNTLYPPPGLANRGSEFTANAAAMGGFGAELYAAEKKLASAQQERDAAQAAMQTDPSEANIKRFQHADYMASVWEGAATFGRMGAITQPVGGLKSMLTRRSPRPDIGNAEAKRLNVEDYLAKRRSLAPRRGGSGGGEPGTPGGSIGGGRVPSPFPSGPEAKTALTGVTIPEQKQLPPTQGTPTSPQSNQRGAGSSGQSPSKSKGRASKAKGQGNEPGPEDDKYWEGKLTKGMKRGGIVGRALAIAKGFATGGAVHAGPIQHAADGGRTDTVPLDVASGSYVVPADIISGLGQGDTTAGYKVLTHMFGQQAPKPSAPGGTVPIMAAGGEFVVAPEAVAKIGKGDVKSGHNILDSWVKTERRKNIMALRQLPGPAQD